MFNIMLLILLLNDWNIFLLVSWFGDEKESIFDRFLLFSFAVKNNDRLDSPDHALELKMDNWDDDISTPNVDNETSLRLFNDELADEFEPLKEFFAAVARDRLNKNDQVATCYVYYCVDRSCFPHIDVIPLLSHNYVPSRSGCMRE